MQEFPLPMVIQELPLQKIIEYIQALNQDRPLAVWCTNEKTAYEEALGVSYVGRRALVTMKHVGLNVAADPFVNSALLNIRGGLVLLAADDPGMHSSQNEQDSRFYADFAKGSLSGALQPAGSLRNDPGSVRPF